MNFLFIKLKQCTSSTDKFQIKLYILHNFWLYLYKVLYFSDAKFVPLNIPYSIQHLSENFNR